jgi:transcriptional regulator with XRE-family HTH domain
VPTDQIRGALILAANYIYNCKRLQDFFCRRAPVRRHRLMGSARAKPERLAEKLRQIRLTLGLTQSELVRSLGVEDKLDYTRVSGFESGLREPTLEILLKYARLARINMEALVDDTLDLPTKLPGSVSHADIQRCYARRRKR